MTRFFAENKIGETFEHEDASQVLVSSQRLWSKTKVANVELLISRMKEYFETLNPFTHSMSLEAICSPMYLVVVGEAVRLLLTVQDRCHVLPSHEGDILVTATEEMPGYAEEDLLCCFVQTTYRGDFSALVRDVDLAYRSMTARCRYSLGIVYMHDRVVKASRMPGFACFFLHSPCAVTGIPSCIIDLVSIIVRSSGCESKEMVRLFTKPLSIEDEEEWRVVCLCRAACNLPWYGTFDRDVTMKFGTTCWTTERHMTTVHYDGSCYREGWEHRLSWIATWVGGLMSKTICVSQSPKVLVARLVLLLNKKHGDH